MLNIGIVGLRNAKVYIETLEHFPSLCFKGIYDPCLLMDRFGNYDFNVFQSFGELCSECHAVVFSIDDNLYMPLISEAVRHSLDVFINGVHNFEVTELQSLLRLRDEAGTIVHVGHPLIYSDIFQTIRRHCGHPLDIECKVIKNDKMGLLPLAYTELCLMLALVKTTVHKVSVNVYSSFSSVPDTLRIRLDFDNGAVGNVCVCQYGQSQEHSIKVLGYNSIVEVDLLHRQMVETNSDNPDEPIRQKLKTFGKTVEQMQINAFCTCMMGGSVVHNSLENEIRTHLAFARINEKVRVNFNVF